MAQILAWREVYQDFGILGLINKIYHNSRTEYDIDLKLGELLQLDEKNSATTKKLTMASCRQVMTLPDANFRTICPEM